MIGLPSSGLHSNGYTLARRALAGVPYEDARLDRPLGRRSPRADRDLRPARARAAALARRRSRARPHHGRRAQQSPAPGRRRRVRDRRPAAGAPGVRLIRELGEVSDAEMDDVFNMGCGFCCVVAAEDEAAALKLLRGAYPEAKRVGRAWQGRCGDEGRQMQVAILIFDGSPRSTRWGPTRCSRGFRTLSSRSLRPSRASSAPTPALSASARTARWRIFEAGGRAGPGRPGQPTVDDGPIACSTGSARRTRVSTWTTSVCTGSLVLGAAGILDGKRATTHWAFLDDLSELRRDARRRARGRGRQGDDRRRGLGSGIDMALTLAARIAGEDVAQGRSSSASSTTRSRPSTPARRQRPRPRSSGWYAAPNAGGPAECRSDAR